MGDPNPLVDTSKQKADLSKDSEKITKPKVKRPHGNKKDDGRSKQKQQSDAELQRRYGDDVCELLEDGGACDAGTLRTSPSSVDFGKLKVGQRTTTTVTVSNTDTTNAVEIGQATVENSGLGDFQIFGVNVVVPPGGTANVTVGFAPTSAGEHTGFAHIAGNNGAAMGGVQLRGEGVESAAQMSERVQQQDVASDAQRDDPNKKFRPERDQAEHLVETWYSGLSETVHATARYSSTNWTRFLAETGGDFTVSWTEGQFINAVGAVGSGIIGLAPGGPAIDFALSVLFSLIYGGVFTAKSNRDTEDTVHDTLKKTGHAAEDQINRFNDYAESSIARAQGLRSTAISKVWAATTQDEIEQVRDWAQAEKAALRPKPSSGDLTLYKNLMKDWVLERAGNASSAGKGTNHKAYDEARMTAYGLKGGEKIARNDLFTYQARHEWSQLSLGDIASADAELQSKIASATALGVQNGLTGADLSSLVLNTIGTEVWTFLSIPDPVMTAHALEPINVNVSSDRLNGRRMGCQMFLRLDGASIVVDSYNYHLDGYIGRRTP